MAWRRNKHRYKTFELNPDEILLDVHNLPQFNSQQFEGRVERAISKRTLGGVLFFMELIVVFFTGRLGYLQIAKADYYQNKSELNSLNHIPIFADRGLIYDRNGVELAWNNLQADNMPTKREYIKEGGYASLLGYVSYPQMDEKGFFWQEKIVGKDGVEKQFDELLAGINGTRLIETDVSGNILSSNTIDVPTPGINVVLSIDSRLQSVLFAGIQSIAEQSGYKGGAGAIMDITTGELLAMTSFPEYDQAVLSDGEDNEKINEYLSSSSKPFLNRVTEGLYTPGSIIKPFLALAALQENIISPSKIIVSTGELRIPNPYLPGEYTVFKDNAAHGAVDMRRAIAVSSNVYFYEIGGGFGNQPGLGINNIERYAYIFGIGKKTGINLLGEIEGVVPSIAWKSEHFPGDPWRIGDTYNTSIGQYGFQVTPIQMLRAIAGIASRGTIVTPTIIKYDGSKEVATATLPFEDGYYTVIHEGMRRVVTEGTALSLNTPGLSVAAKTGTAQIKNNTRINSWSIGFFPAEKPRYAFVVLMEDGPKVSTGASRAFRPVLDFLLQNPAALPLD